MGVQFGKLEGTEGPPHGAKFHPHRCNESPLRGEKPQNRPLSKLNAGRFALRAMLPLMMRKKIYKTETLSHHAKPVGAWHSTVGYLTFKWYRWALALRKRSLFNSHIRRTNIRRVVQIPAADCSSTFTLFILTLLCYKLYLVVTGSGIKIWYLGDVKVDFFGNYSLCMPQ